MNKLYTATILASLAVAPALAAGPGRTDANFPVQGSPKTVVILVEFPDLAFQLPEPYSYFDGMLHQDGFDEYFGKGSCLEYFRDNSMQTFAPEFDLYGPVTVSRPSSYYGENINNVLDVHAHEMIIEACEILDDEVDFSQYDADGNGVIDNVFVFYAGLGESSSGVPETVWAHSANISKKEEEPVMIDGVQLDRYACANEWEKNLPTGIGTFCHEFIHVLGLPDLYSTDQSKAPFTPGKWDVMDHGSLLSNERRPCHMNAFERYALGWLEPEELEPGKEYELKPLGMNEACIIRTSNPSEFFLFENRQLEGWDNYLPGHGLLVWHIEVVEDRWAENTVNNDPEHMCVDIIEADNKPTEATINADPFPGARKVTSISRESHPQFCSWSGEGLGIAIVDIAESADGIVTFRVEADGSAVERVLADGYRLDGRTLVASTPVVVTDLAGRTVWRGEGCMDFGSAGVYVVVSAQGARKVMVR